MPIPGTPKAALRLLKDTLRQHDNWHGGMSGGKREDTRKFDVEAVRVLVADYERLLKLHYVEVTVAVDSGQAQKVIDEYFTELKGKLNGKE